VLHDHDTRSRIVKRYTQRVQDRVVGSVGPDEHVLAAAPVMDVRLLGAAVAAAAAGGATGRPWLGALAVLVAFTVLRRTDRATGLRTRAAMVVAVTEHRVVGLRATAWNGPREVLWTIPRDECELTVRTSRWGTGRATVRTPAGALGFTVPWIQRTRAAALVGPARNGG
jgi:hypothetical protein